LFFCFLHKTKNNLFSDHSELFEKYGGPPDSFFSLGVDQFNRNLDAMRGEYKDEEPMKLKLEQISVRKMLKKLTLNTTAVWEREKKYTDMPPSPLIIQIPYNVLCYFLDFVFEGRYVPSRFFFLETVARMPYFSYLSCLHLYETLGKTNIIEHPIFQTIRFIYNVYLLHVFALCLALH
jgi:hypothetical protein